MLLSRGIRLYRRSKAPASVRRRASCWTSIGVVIFLTVSVAVLIASGGANVGSSQRWPRNLGEDKAKSVYPDDPFIRKPEGGTYNDATAGDKCWIFLHIIVIGYMLLGLNTVCDLYFTGALDEMVNKWNIKPDVAGATFMAAGGSAPELFTSLIGAVISESDVGFSTIVGSAVFNVLFVIGLCGFAAQEPIKLTWWPLARDCSYYIVGLCFLAVFAKTDQSISLSEALILFCGYIGYCTLMYNNPKLEERFLNKGKQDTVTEIKPEIQSVVPVVADTGSTCADLVGMPEFSSESSHHSHNESPNSNSVSLQSHQLQAPGIGRASVSGSLADMERHHIKKNQPHFVRKSVAVRMSSKERVNVWDLDQDHPAHSSEREPPPEPPPPLSIAEDPEEEEDDIEALMERPDAPGAQAIWFACLPIYGALYFFIPKPTETSFLRTFAVSLAWIAGFSFFLVYCVEVLGEVLNIHIIIMGFTLLAAGTSIPDLVSSMAVARAGEGDMAVSSSIGSNIFDIMVGLPIPWIIKIVIVEMIAKGNSDAKVNITSDYIVMYVIVLVFMIICVVFFIHSLGWVLNKTLGIGMAVLYVIFLVIVLTVEFTKPPELIL